MSEPDRIWKTGQLCRIVDERGGQKDAKIILASPNGKSIAVEFDGFFSPKGLLGGFLTIMPLAWCDDHFESFDLTGSNEASGVVKVVPRLVVVSSPER